MIVYGRNAVREALRGRARTASSGCSRARRSRASPGSRGRDVRIAAAEEIEERCGSREHQGSAPSSPATPTSRGRAAPAEQPFIVALDEVQDPQNLGAICRTAECAGASGVVICERRAAEVTPAVCRASAGAVEHLRIARARNLADFLSTPAARLLELRRGGLAGGRRLRRARLSRRRRRRLRRRGARAAAARRGALRRARRAAAVRAIASLNVNAAAGALLYAVLRREAHLTALHNCG